MAGAHVQLNELSGAIIAAAIKVHRVLGAGLLEMPYRECLTYELRQRGYRIEVEHAVPLVYESVKLDCAYRLDLVVESTVVVEVKAVDQLAPVHAAQMLTYLRLTGLPLGLLMNFHAPTLKEGLKRVINTAPASVRL